MADREEVANEISSIIDDAITAFMKNVKSEMSNLVANYSNISKTFKTKLSESNDQKSLEAQFIFIDDLVRNLLSDHQKNITNASNTMSVAIDAKIDMYFRDRDNAPTTISNSHSVSGDSMPSSRRSSHRSANSQTTKTLTPAISQPTKPRRGGFFNTAANSKRSVSSPSTSVSQPPPNKKRKREKLTLVVRLMGDDNPFRVKVWRSTAMQRVIESFSDYKGIDQKYLRFCVHGLRLNGGWTAGDVADVKPDPWAMSQVQSGEVLIDVMKEQSGS